MIEVYELSELLKIGRHVLLVDDRIPPGFFPGPNISLMRSVAIYRQLLRWRDEGVKYVKMTYDDDVLVGFNQPYSQYYLWSDRFYNGKMEPVRMPVN